METFFKTADGDYMSDELILNSEDKEPKYSLKRDIWEWVESIAISVTTLILFLFSFFVSLGFPVVPWKILCIAMTGLSSARFLCPGAGRYCGN